jgi:hypothetical protein
MARDRRRHAQKEGLPAMAVPPGDAMPSTLSHTGHQACVRLSHVKPPHETMPHAKHLSRITSCLQTVAILLETNHAYLPIFLRLEAELKDEQLKQDAITRSKIYLPRMP